MQPQNPCIEREEIDLMKKLIGLIPLYDDDKDSYWMLPGYMKVLEACGHLTVMLPLTTHPERKPAEYHAAEVIRWKRICLRKRYRKTSRYLESAEAYSL